MPSVSKRRLGSACWFMWRTFILILNSENKPTAEEQHDVDHCGMPSIIVSLGAKHRMCRVVLRIHFCTLQKNYREL